MTSRQELKSIAKQSLSGKWGFSIALVLIILLLPSILNFIPLLGALVVIVITPAITYLPLQMFLKVKRNENPEIGEVFSSLFSKLGDYWGIFLRIFLKLLPSYLISLFGVFLMIIALSIHYDMIISSTSFTLLVIIGGFLNIVGSILVYSNSLYYVLAIYIKQDNPNMTCKEAILESKELMTGHRVDYFVLSLSFIGWGLIASFTFGLALFYLIPYMNTTFAAFYDDLASIKNYAKENNNDAIQF